MTFRILEVDPVFNARWILTISCSSSSNSSSKQLGTGKRGPTLPLQRQLKPASISLITYWRLYFLEQPLGANALPFL